MNLPTTRITAPPSGATSRAWLSIGRILADEVNLRHGPYLTGDVESLEFGDVALPFDSTAAFPVVLGLGQIMHESLVAERQTIAEQFAASLVGRGDVHEVWLTSVDPELVVSVITDDLDLQRDLEIRAIFIDFLRALGDVSEGELELHSNLGGIPEDVRSGTRLL